MYDLAKKVDVPNSIIDLNQTHEFECYIWT